MLLFGSVIGSLFFYPKIITNEERNDEKFEIIFCNTFNSSLII
jgi:hypothetical protein